MFFVSLGLAGWDEKWVLCGSLTLLGMACFCIDFFCLVRLDGAEILMYWFRTVGGGLFLSSADWERLYVWNIAFIFLKARKSFYIVSIKKECFSFRLAWLDEMKNGSLRFFDIIRDGLLLCWFFVLFVWMGQKYWCIGFGQLGAVSFCRWQYWERLYVWNIAFIFLKARKSFYIVSIKKECFSFRLAWWDEK